MIELLHHVTGPCVSLASLRCLFPQLSVCVLRDLLTRYKHVWRCRYAPSGFRLTWHQPGRVWAIDHSQASCAVDGTYTYLVAIRDLASHRQLAWAPCTNTGAKQAAAMIEDLFLRHGPPLILKSDNGSAFISELFDQLALQHTVAQLFNPPRHPQYNGALERSNGTLKIYTQQHAMRQGHPFRWTNDDLEAARQLANTITRPWGHRGPTPQEAWEMRNTITDPERRQFQQALNAQRAAAREDLGLTPDQKLDRSQQAQLDRLAISRAAEQLGYLTIKRTRRSGRPKRICKRRAMQLAAAHHANNETLRGSSNAKRNKKKLATGQSRVTMPAEVLNTSVHPQNADFTPNAKAWAFTSWKRRFITPLLYLLKAANIKH